MYVAYPLSSYSSEIRYMVQLAINACATGNTNVCPSAVVIFFIISQIKKNILFIFR
jgi:hypothetical protein